MLFGDILRQNAMKFPNKTALICGDDRVSYLELNSQVNRLANTLLATGMKKGDRVAVVADNCIQYVEAYYAVAKGGMIIVPINTTLDSSGVSYLINDTGAGTVIFGENYSDTINSIYPGLKTVNNYIAIGNAAKAESYEELVSRYSPDEPEVAIDEDDTIGIWYTSGTTGWPKGVAVSHKSLISEIVNMMLNGYPINRNDVNLAILPLSHLGGQYLMKNHFYIGGTSVLLETLEPKLILETIEREKVTTSLFTPAVVFAITDYSDVNRYDVSSIRIIMYAGAPLPEGAQSRMNEIFGDILMQCYGASEVPVIMMPPLLEGPWEKVKRPGSCGKEITGIEVRLVNEEGDDVAQGEIGELLVRGDNMMKGYWNMPEETAKVLEGGYFHTGDLATKDDEGYYYVVGRKEDTIVTGGKPVYSAEVESVISLHPSISEVAVIDVPDVRLGKLVKAVVVLKVGEKASEEDIIKWCASRLEAYKVPKSVDIVDSLPRTAIGKILKRALRDRYSKGE